MPDGNYRRCENCDVEAEANKLWRIHAPVPNPGILWLCGDCWRGLLGEGGQYLANGPAAKAYA